MILTYPAGSNTDNPSGLEKKNFKPHQHLVKLQAAYNGEGTN